MSRVAVVTTSYPERAGDAQGHFVAAEVQRLTERASVTVLAPGEGRRPLGAEAMVGLPGSEAFGFPGALERLRQRPSRALAAARFTAAAHSWLRGAAVERVVAHFLLPCGVPIATRALRRRDIELEIVVHGSDARLFARLPARRLLGRELLTSGARLRFVSTELRELVLSALGPSERALLAARSRVEPCAIDVDGVPRRREARELLGIGHDERVAVIVARLVAGKRVHVSLEACRRLPRLQAIVVGEGPERPALERSFPEASFVGHVARPRALAYLSAADVLVSASREEGAPTVVREARALGTPVVCLPAGDLRAWAELDAGIHLVG